MLFALTGLSLQDDKPGPGTYLSVTTDTQSGTSFSKRGTGSFASKVCQLRYDVLNLL